MRDSPQQVNLLRHVVPPKSRRDVRHLQWSVRPASKRRGAWNKRHNNPATVSSRLSNKRPPSVVSVPFMAIPLDSNIPAGAAPPLFRGGVVTGERPGLRVGGRPGIVCRVTGKKHATERPAALRRRLTIPCTRPGPTRDYRTTQRQPAC